MIQTGIKLKTVVDFLKEYLSIIIAVPAFIYANDELKNIYQEEHSRYTLTFTNFLSNLITG